MKLATWIALSLLCACSRGANDASEGDADDASGSGGKNGAVSTGGAPAQLPDTDFILRDEWQGPCAKANVVDVNLGNAPDIFVRAAQCQISGTEPDAATVTELSSLLRTDARTRRVDVVRTLCSRANRTCVLNYTDPWQQQVELTAACVRKGTRELGAVLMYWSDCPAGVNCGLNWANTHAVGMSVASPLLSFGNATTGYYNPKNAGFWRRELLDARWSGLQFLLLNTFGPDLAQLPQLVSALEDVGGIQVALFDDTWGWNKQASPAPYNQNPSFDDPETASGLIYQKWHDFYTAVPKSHWYRYEGRPLIAFYNAGTLHPQPKCAPTLQRLRERFKAEFSEDPFLVIDTAFFQDPNTSKVADAQFRWNTFDGGGLSHFDTNGVSFDHFMAKWDSVGRDHTGLPIERDRIVKGPELLDQYLEQSASSDLAMMATWNDLGEGTGLNRNYDYYYQGQWQPPTAFMKRIRDAQCQ